MKKHRVKPFAVNVEDSSMKIMWVTQRLGTLSPGCAAEAVCCLMRAGAGDCNGDGPQWVCGNICGSIIFLKS